MNNIWDRKPDYVINLPYSCFRPATKKTASGKGRWNYFFLKHVLMLPKWRRLNAQRSQIDIALASVVDFIVNRVKEGRMDFVFILAKSHIRLLKSFGAYLRPELFDPFGDFIPFVE